MADPEWKPIESAPKGVKVLLYWPEHISGKYHQMRLVPMMRVDFAWSTPHRLPTHWMPLPAPPVNQP